MKKCLFVSLSNYVNSALGGVQRCTKEYLEVIQAAGWELEIIPYEIDRRWQSRLLRKLKPSSFHNRISPDFVSDLCDRVKAKNIPWVFLNQVDALPIAPRLKIANPELKIILLSHGAQFVDDFLAASDSNLLDQCDPALLAHTVLDEINFRKHINHVFTLSEQEVAFERWLGAKSVSWLPRSISPKPLSWQPIAGRSGFVGTLEHPPNYNGLFKVLSSLDSQGKFDGCIRIVSGSEKLGTQLAEKFPFVNYLGRLSTQALQVESASWCWFIHPLFCWSRGCSTKLADALEWQIPVLTTEAGCRGYTWTDGSIVKANSPEEFSHFLKHLEIDDTLLRAKADIVTVSSSSPKISDVAQAVNHALFNEVRYIDLPDSRN